jgi:predicted DNA-binding protein
MRENKMAFAHLRVRLPEADKQFLADLSAKLGKRINISRAVKYLIEKEKASASASDIYPETREKIAVIAKMLRRTTAQVTEEAIETILEMIESERLPLMVLELRLVKTYAKNLNRNGARSKRS